MKRFEELIAWQKARALTKAIFQATKPGEFSKNYSLVSQIQRAAVSIVANIAEGFERDGKNEFRQFLSHAKGSAGEVRSQLYIALDGNFINQTEFDLLSAEARDISKLIGGFMKYLRNSEIPGTKFKKRFAP